MESQSLSVVVLAAGLGKRMKSQRPKVLHRLAGLPIAAHVLRAIAPLAPSTTVLVVGHGSDRVKTELGEAYGPGDTLPIRYAEQNEQLGTGHAVMMAEPALTDYHGSVLVAAGDAPLVRPNTLSALVNRHRQSRAVLTMLTSIISNPAGYGRVVRDAHQNLIEVVEEKNATLAQRALNEINSGVYVFDSEWLWSRLQKVELSAQGEYYITDLIGMAIREDRASNPRTSPAARPASSPKGRSGVVTFTLEGLEEAMGINSRAQLAHAEAVVQARLRQHWLDEGVTMLVPDSIYLDMDVTIGQDSVLYPGVILEGNTGIGPGCVLGPNTHIVSSIVGAGCRITNSTVEHSIIERDVTVGPYSHVRGNSTLGEGVHLGNFAEVNRSRFGPGVKMGHFSYMGDAMVGEETNIGAGTVSVNFDGTRKHHTNIGDHAFIGSGSMLVAPIEIGEGGRTGAGSVATKNVPPYSLAVGVPARVIKRFEPEDGKSGTASSGVEEVKETETDESRR